MQHMRREQVWHQGSRQQKIIANGSRLCRPEACRCEDGPSREEPGMFATKRKQKWDAARHPRRGADRASPHPRALNLLN